MALFDYLLHSLPPNHGSAASIHRAASSACCNESNNLLIAAGAGNDTAAVINKSKTPAVHRRSRRLWYNTTKTLYLSAWR